METASFPGPLFYYNAGLSEVGSFAERAVKNLSKHKIGYIYYTMADTSGDDDLIIQVFTLRGYPDLPKSLN